MNLIKDNSFRAPKLGKMKWYLLGGVTILLVIANFIQTKTEIGQSPRVLEYAEKLRLPSDAQDSVVIKTMYERLNLLYDRINTFNFDTTTEFGSKVVVPSGFHSKLITYDLLDFMFDTLKQRTRAGTAYQSEMGYDSYFDNVISTMGNGNFSYEFSAGDFNKGFASDARYVLSDKYVMVLVDLNFVRPDYTEGEDEFQSGSYTGAVMLYDITTLRLHAYMRFSSRNSAEGIRSVPLKEYAMEEKLFKDIEGNVTFQVNHFSKKYLGLSLYPVNWQ